MFRGQKRKCKQFPEAERLLPESKQVNYEDLTAKIGYGRFHYCLLALCGWALSSDAIEILSISFILPPATCELSLSDSSKGWLNSAVFLGMMLGGYIWGTLADMQGRRSVLMFSLSLNSLGGLMSTFAQSFWLFLLLRIVSGIGVGGSMPVIFSYFTEFQSKQRRGAMISFLATFWMCGNIIAAALAWIVIPRKFEVSSGGFQYNTWRLYLALCIIPSFTSAVMFIFMPESPRYLIEKHRNAEALTVLQKIYKLNNKGREAEEFPCQFFSKTKLLMKPPLLTNMSIMIIIFFTLSFGYYGLFMWFPELFQRIEKYGGSACHPGSKLRVNSTVDPCTVSSDLYFKGFLTAVSNLPGNIFTILFIDRLGRTPLLASSMMLSGLSVFFIWFLKTEVHSLIMACVFSGISVVGFNALDVLCAEIFPTHSRSTASGILTGIGRIAAILGNLAFGSLVTSHCAVPMLLVAILLSGGGLISLKLPNTKNQDLL
ncbi:hypothetical protein LSH36_62g00013 [Paralvinella palmiformis]|uniref:Major facilitator superfamily (MFS) profile domain-containing protein n=1 Tax=Paralvinella palmiformis TaxID=53620 RepID=A0AAD9K415_9ANNE|nr:hypothetical protein LSH36_62g00013 [Paralvinella palmiformis]